MISVLVASDHPVVRAGLSSIIAAADDLTLAGEAAAADLVARVGELRPDVVLLEGGAAEGLDLVWQLTNEAAGTGSVILGREASEEALRQAFRAGARGYLLWEASAEEILAALRAVAEGLVVVSPALVPLLLSAGAARPTPHSVDQTVPGELAEPLTPREMEVLQLLTQGLPSKTIAARLGLSEHTVKFHIGSLLAKLGASSRTEAVTLAIRRGLLTL